MSICRTCWTTTRVPSSRDPIEALLATARADIVASRNESYPNEAVGIICSDGNVFPLINQARSAHRFSVGETLVGEAINHLKYRGKQPVAVYHSHPESTSGPSASDEQMMEEMPGAVFVIAGTDGMSAWTWSEELVLLATIPLED